MGYREIYVDALREIGFRPEWAERGVEMVEKETRSGEYLGFRHLVRVLERRAVATLDRPHRVEAVIERMVGREGSAATALKDQVEATIEANHRKRLLDECEQRLANVEWGLAVHKAAKGGPLTTKQAAQWAERFPSKSSARG